jgi:hypothetical protein
VVVDLHSGTYYSLRGGAAVAWEWAVAGSSVDGIVAAAPQLESTLCQLLDAQLLVATGRAPSPVVAPEGAIEPPLVEVYHDLEELLQLDPIHDVDATGWPRPAEA